MDLVILAAGLGSRFGGNKQIEPVDEDGNFILDYSVFDAVRAGFDRVILIIRKEHEELFENKVLARIKNIIPIEFAFQSMEDVPQGTKIPKERMKPWGTAHALYSCREIVSDRFAVINADDFYGFAAFKEMAEFLRNSKDNEFLSVGFRVKNTLPAGQVKRGIFELDKGRAVKLVESRVERRGEKIFATPLNEENWREISPETIVSMTMFGFSKEIMNGIKDAEKTFFAQNEEKLKVEELLLPDVVNSMSRTHIHYVHPTSSTWFGVTYREDLEQFKNAIHAMKERGEYPKHLFAK